MPRAITAIVDDTDSRFTYEGTWTKHQNDHEYGHSSHLTHGSGTVTLKFRGTSIAVYGTLASSQESQADPVPPMSLYTLENGFSAQYKGHPTAQSQYRSQFFKMDHLPFGDHVLVVKNTAENDMFLLDYVEIGVPAKQLPVGALVGTILGSVLVTVLLILGAVLYRRRRLSRNKHTSFLKSDDSLSVANNQGDGSIVPYDLNNPPQEESVWTRLGQTNPLSLLNPKERSRDIEGGFGVGNEGSSAPRSVVISVCCDSCVAVGGANGNTTNIPPPYSSGNSPNPAPAVW